MKRLIFMSLSLLLFASCSDQQPCDSVSLAYRDYVNVKIVSNSGIGGFVDNGYNSFEVLEIKKSFPTNYNGYFDETQPVDFTSLKLPIAHNYNTSTFVFRGDTVAPDTIQISNYNARAMMTDNCGYRLTIDSPSVSIFTFQQKSAPVFDEQNKILTFKIIK